MNAAIRIGLLSVIASSASVRAAAQPVVGPAGAGTTMVTTGQLVRPVGHTAEIPARPVDIARSPDGRFVYVKEHTGLTVLDAKDWSVRQRLSLGENPASMTGLVVSPDGKTVYLTDATNGIRMINVAEDGKVSAGSTLKLPATGGKGYSFPCGIALSDGGKRAVVCLSRNNTLGLVDLEKELLEEEIAVGVAPYAVVLAPDGHTAYVSDWGGRRPRDEEPGADTSGTRALIDERGVAASGGVSIVDLREKKEVAFIETGLSASGMALTLNGKTLFVANSNNDTVSVVDTASHAVVRQIVAKPDAGLPFGSMPAGLALSPDQGTLYVACAGNNAIAVVRLADSQKQAPSIVGWIPTDWYPGAILASEKELIAANIKGVGSRTARQDGSFNSRRHRGSVQRLELPGEAALAEMSESVRRNGLLPQVMREVDAGQKRVEAKAVPVPQRPGEPSSIEHVIYVIKENRTYDQMFGDLAAGEQPRGNGKPELCIYGREITPNHHALAEQFVLLDNYYCNGVLSADGHSWATEGNVTPYLERSFGGFKRSYTYGDDPLTYSSSGFIWDHVLAAGLSFKNFGELAEATVVAPKGKGKKWADVHADWKAGTHEYSFTETIGIEKLRRYSDMGMPGWCLDIPDQVRADRFIGAIKQFEADGSMPSLILVHLPNDHTNGVSENHPTPRAMLADNDLALGRIVEAVSKSKFWGTTCMFINEDDPQDGWDHVDGHRSICLVVGPQVKRGAVVSEFYNQAGVVHTIERIFGLTAVNQSYAMAPVMSGCFAEKADLTSYTAITPSVAIDEMNPPKSKPKPKVAPGDGTAPPSQKGNGQTGAASESGLDLYALTAKQDLSKPDRVNDGEFNLVLWHAAKGDAPYPKEFSGAHGKGLQKLGLKLAPGGAARVEDDDDD